MPATDRTVTTPVPGPVTTLPARWHSENGTPPPDRVVLADDRLRADTAHRLASDGDALLWQGDYHGARQLLTALARRVERESRLEREACRGRAAGPTTAGEVFREQRRERARAAHVLGRLVVRLEDDHALLLRRAPDVRQACREAYGPPDGARVVALRELLGVLGAQQWRERGVEVPALGARVHPHYGVFSPVRGEYVDLVARAPLPAAALGHGTAFDLGTGTGVLAAVLARRGVGRVLVTDANPRALRCARDNAHRLGLADRIRPAGTGLYPPGCGRAGLVVCNPPWLPAEPASALELGVYDPGGRMLHGFLSGLAERLVPGGEGWLVLSDLAEHLGLRSHTDLRTAFATAGLRVVGRLDARPRHRRATEAARRAGARQTDTRQTGARTADPLDAARAAEVTSLWRLAPA
ncbi:class I SAM-dependent methyltransferase [Kitasatospora sp. NPDC097605]|uniref:class I SAM-dependent methyltransferase n=1 Tax=Kitasatospora sp. NPDC097605 TaxID=3157226 RepID=UPI00332A080D